MNHTRIILYIALYIEVISLAQAILWCQMDPDVNANFAFHYWHDV